MSIFQIVQLDPAAAKWLGYAKQQCKRIMDTGTKDFYREWTLEGMTVRAKAYGGTVKLWLIAGGAKIISRGGEITPADSNYYFLTAPTKNTLASVNPPISATISAKTKSIPAVVGAATIPDWLGMPSSRYKNWVYKARPTVVIDPVSGKNLMRIQLMSMLDSSPKNMVVDVSGISMSDDDASAQYSFRVGDDTMLIISLRPSRTIVMVSVSSGIATYSADMTNDGISSAPECSDNAGWIYYLWSDKAYVLRLTINNGVCSATRVDMSAVLTNPSLPTTVSASSSKAAFGLVWISTATSAGQIGVVHVTEAGVKQERSYSFADIQAITPAAIQNINQDLTQSAYHRMYVSDTETYTAATTRSANLSVPYDVCIIAINTLQATVAHRFTAPNGGDGFLGASFWEGYLCIGAGGSLWNNTVPPTYFPLLKIMSNSGSILFDTEFQTITPPASVQIVGSSPRGIYASIPTVASPTSSMYNQIDTSSFSVVRTWPATSRADLLATGIIVTPDTDFVVWSEAAPYPYNSFIQDISNANFKYTIGSDIYGTVAYATHVYIPEQRTLLFQNRNISTTRFGVTSVGGSAMSFVPATSITITPSVDIPVYITPWTYEGTPAAKHADWISQMRAMQPALPP